jgi:hypothetical protein
MSDRIRAASHLEGMEEASPPWPWEEEEVRSS